jgi:hypothetical protein
MIIRVLLKQRVIDILDLLYIKGIKSRTITWKVHAACMRRYKIIVAKSGEVPLGTQRRKCRDNINADPKTSGSG